MTTFVLILAALTVVIGMVSDNSGLSQATKELLKAAEDDNKKAIRQAITAGADVNARNEAGKTPLIYVIKNGYVDGIWLLLKHGACVGLSDKEGKTPLMYAAEVGDLGTVEIFVCIMKLDINESDSRGWAPLMYASQRGHEDVVKFLIWQGSKINAANNSGFKPLLKASFGGHVKVVNLLLENGADVDGSITKDWTAILAASFNTHADVVNLLIQHGADVNASNEGKTTPLMYAVQNQDGLRVIKVLLEAGADTEAVNTNGFRAYDLAAMRGYREIAAVCAKKRA
ncbi:MAG: ankyrin repeat domain-containing protein [Candidatus Paceibacterota bacterium]